MKLQILTIAILIFIGLSLVGVSAVTVRSAEVFPVEIEPGKTATVSLTLENNLNEDVKDISVSLDLKDLPFAPYKSSNEKTIDELSEDEEETISFKIIALADSKSEIYQIPIKIIYFDDDGDEHIKDSLISVTVNSPATLDVKIEDGLLLKGQKNEIVIKVVNKGLSDVKFLEIELGLSTRYNLLSLGKVYIGDIDSDDFDSADFQIYFKENAPSTINLPVTLMYRDAVNNEYEDDFNLQLRVYSKDQAIELGLLEKSRTGIYIGTIVVVAVIWFIYRKIRKKRKLRKAASSA